jgi:hypothetical protein
MGKSLRSSAAALGSRGGRAGVGASKRRGDSDFYRRLVALRKDRQGMEHRHLNHQDFTLPAIDDIISNGQWDSWERLRLALRSRAGIRDKILRICTARVQFWRNYAQVTGAPSCLPGTASPSTPITSQVLAQLESVAGWQTARVQRPIQILGSLDGILTGMRQLIRSKPASQQALAA